MPPTYRRRRRRNANNITSTVDTEDNESKADCGCNTAELEPKFKGKVIVLDIDETLIHTMDDMTSLSKLNIMKDASLMDLRERCFFIDIQDAVGKLGKGEVEKMWAIKRPHLDDFLKFAFDYFDMVIVWSAGADRYVRSIVDTLFQHHQQPHVVYSRSDCVSDNRAHNHKPLQKMLSQVDGIDKLMGLENTFCIDDKESTYINNPDNGILIPAFQPKANIDQLRLGDDALLKLQRWLEQKHIKDFVDVRMLSKDGIF